MNELRLRRAREAARDLLRTIGGDGEVTVPVEDIAHTLAVELVRGDLQNALESLIRAGDRARSRIAEHHDHPGQLRFSTPVSSGTTSCATGPPSTLRPAAHR